MAGDAPGMTDIPERTLWDTSVINRIYNNSAYIFEGEEGWDEPPSDFAEVKALRHLLLVNERAHFQFVVSPLTVAEVANTTDFADRERRLRWLLDLLDHTIIMLDESGARTADGGTYRHRFKLPAELQRFEKDLLEIADFRRDPVDRLLLIQHRMGGCDAFITLDKATIWRHRETLAGMGVRVLTPSEHWRLVKPWAGLWR